MAKVKIILSSKIKKYGNPGDTVSVKMGYGIYLVKTKNALYATEENIQHVKKNLSEIIKKDEEKRNKFQAIANKIADIKTIKIIKKANSNGKLHGSVNESTIIDLLLQKKISISKHNINSFICKFVGEQIIKFQFKGGIETQLHLIIEKEKDENI